MGHWRVTESQWRNIAVRHFGGMITMLTDTSSVSTWALEEARRRLEEEGILPDPSKQPKKD